MYRPLSLVRSFLILALGGLVLPLRAQQEAALPAPAGAVAPLGQATFTQMAPAEAPANAPAAGYQTAPDQRQGPGQAQTAPQSMTRRDQRQARREQVEMRLRAMMSDFGIDDEAKQDALIAYLAEDEAGKATVREAGKRLLMALRSGTETARTRDLVRVYKGALDADKERRAAAQTSLDAKIGFSLNPRLEAVLWLFGVLGEGQAGLPLNALMPRPRMTGSRNAPPPYGNRFTPPNNLVQGVSVPRAGTVFGAVSNKGEGWIEVQDQKGGRERFIPFWTAATVAGADNANGGGYDRSVLEAMSIVKVGDTIRLSWVWNERKRVVKLEPWAAPLPDENDAAENLPEAAPNAPGPGGAPEQPETPQQP